MKSPRTPTQQESVLSQGLRWYLYLTAASTGAAIMIVEILGAKMLSPYIGMSHFVWTAQIAVTLVSLACGYYVGGRWADQAQKLHRLYGAILAAAACLVLTVLICEPVAFWCLDFNLAVGSLLASTIIFFVPLALLAMTGPFLIRVITSNVAGLGGNVGRLTAIGTLGSFVGTMCIGYVMVPLLANSTSMYLTAAGLTLLSAGYYIVFHRSVSAMATTAVLILVTGGLAASTSRPKRPLIVERFYGNSHFGEIQVLDHPNGRQRLFCTDLLIQNTYDPVSKRSSSAFTHMLFGLPRAYNTNIQDVLCIGMGVGIVPMEFARLGARVDVVEINPAIEPVAVEFFDLEPERLQITIDDGRHFLNGCPPKQYDVVVLDAFLGDSSPSHLMTREAFAAMRRALRPGGVLVLNAFCRTDAGNDFFATSLNRTIRSVFPEVRMHYGRGQAYIAAGDSLQLIPQTDWSWVHTNIVTEVKDAFRNVIDLPPDLGQVLTDDFNPVEFYDAHNREALRRQLALQTRKW